MKDTINELITAIFILIATFFIASILYFSLS